MSTYQAIVIIALFGILGALLAPSAHAIPDKVCYGPAGVAKIVKESQPCPAGFSG